ncbi:hypothetical protein [Vibrio sp. 1CM23M]|uniref:hypothetical protein n=1 Tax=Vibrio sp. 1CM23M TaxID=2929164 RepID=UPI0020C06AB5|nr:hypothetical protein [Vibrio sp. 1CM23M]MCK8072449.1 hypothetical protein [Vibrio sp. 1CM23M]
MNTQTNHKKDLKTILYVPMKEEAKTRLRAIYSQFGVRNLAPFLEGIINGKKFTFMASEDRSVKRNSGNLFNRNAAQIREYFAIYVKKGKPVFDQNNAAAIDIVYDLPLTQGLNYLKTTPKTNTDYVNVCLEYIELALEQRDTYFTEYEMVDVEHDDEWFKWYFNELTELVQLSGGNDTSINIDRALFDTYVTEIFKPRANELQHETAQTLSKLLEQIDRCNDTSDESNQFVKAVIQKEVKELLSGETVYIPSTGKLSKRSLAKKPTRYQSLIRVAQDLKIEERAISNKHKAVVSEIDAAMLNLNEAVLECNKIKLSAKNEQGLERDLNTEEKQQIYKILMKAISLAAQICVNAITRNAEQKYIDIMTKDYGYNW